MEMRRARMGAIALGCLVATSVACRQTPDAIVSAPNETASAPVSDTVPPPSSPGTPETPASEASPPIATGNAPTPPPPLPEECNAPQTQQAMNLCAEAEYAQADATLNQVYQSVKGNLSANQVDALITAEKAWIDFRDTNCAFVQSQYAGGSIAPMVYYGCMTTTTQDRVDVLQGQVNTALSYGAADAALNETYQTLKNVLSETQQDLLTTAQLAWLDYRDTHCAYAPGEETNCLAALTAARTADLQNQLEARSL